MVELGRRHGWVHTPLCVLVSERYCVEWIDPNDLGNLGGLVVMWGVGEWWLG